MRSLGMIMLSPHIPRLSFELSGDFSRFAGAPFQIISHTKDKPPVIAVALLALALLQIAGNYIQYTVRLWPGGGY
ncbi:hypothetical protein SD208_10435 [Ochrobactrum sp. BD67]